MKDPFDFEPHTAPYSNWTTSREAAQKIARWMKAGRRKVYNLLLLEGPHADFQTSQRLGLSENTVRPRRGELVDAGLVRDSGEVVPTEKGTAVLWEVVPDPDPDRFVAYRRKKEEEENQLRGLFAIYNLPVGNVKQGKVEVQLTAAHFQALCNELHGSEDPLLFDILGALSESGFEADFTTELSDEDDEFGFGAV